MKSKHSLTALARLLASFMSKSRKKMIMQDIDKLNEQFAIANCLRFTVEKGGFVVVNINNQYAKAEISTYAGQILSFLPHSESEDLVFLSNKAKYRAGKAIRGGIPICWPWFADDISGFGQPSHGFVRNQQWQVVSTDQNIDGSVKLILGLDTTDDTRAIWPYDFQLRLEIEVGQNIGLKLTAKNTGHTEMTITQAIHTYFNISDIEKISVTGLDGVEYLDKLKGFAKSTQLGEVQISQATDRIFQPVKNDVNIIDPVFNRTITLAATGSQTTVVWNPWTTAVSDLDGGHYRRFLCVETANTANDTISLAEGESHSISVIYSIS